MPNYFFLGTQSIIDEQQKTYAIIRDKCMTVNGQDLYEHIHMIAAQKFKFRFGTLDIMLSLNDQLIKIDNQLQGLIRKVEKQRLDFGGDGDLRVETTLGKQSVSKFLQSFKWDDQKYSRSKTLIEICSIIKQRMNENQSGVRKMMQIYTETKNHLSALSKKEGGNFFNRDIKDLIYEHDANPHCFCDTEHLTSLVVILGKKAVNDWYTCYENIDKFVVPRSSQPLNIQDKDGTSLHSFVVFKNVADAVIHQTKAKKFIVRKFIYDKDQFLKQQEEKLKLQTKLKTLQTGNLKTLDTIFGQLFEALIHLKVIRIFIDAVLRFGVPPKFCSLIFKPKVNKQEKIMKNLIDRFADPKLKGMYGSKEEIEDQEDFYPFVLIPLTVPSEEKK